MGVCISVSAFASFLGLLGFPLVIKDDIFASFWGNVLLFIAILSNIITAVGVVCDKSKYKGMRFRTSQIVYFIIVALIAVFWVVSIISGGFAGKVIEPLVFLGAYIVMVFDETLFIGLLYFGSYFHEKKTGEQKSIYLEANENRNTKKSLQKAFAFIGAFSLLLAAIIFVVGCVGARDSGDVAYTSCYKCDGYGVYSRNGIVVSCDACNGSGIGAYRESGDNIFAGAALWIAVLGIGSLVMVNALKDKK